MATKSVEKILLAEEQARLNECRAKKDNIRDMEIARAQIMELQCREIRQAQIDAAIMLEKASKERRSRELSAQIEARAAFEGFMKKAAKKEIKAIKKITSIAFNLEE